MTASVLDAADLRCLFLKRRDPLHVVPRARARCAPALDRMSPQGRQVFIDLLARLSLDHALEQWEREHRNADEEDEHAS